MPLYYKYNINKRFLNKLSNLSLMINTCVSMKTIIYWFIISTIVKPFIFFDLGQTLIDEWDYINYFDNLLFETLNGYGAKIDYRNYFTLRNNVIFTRRIGSSGFLNIVSSMVQTITSKRL